jgi:hypothetical protein
LRQERAAASDRDRHPARGEAKRRIDAGGPASGWPPLTTEQEMEDVSAVAAEAVVDVDEVAANRPAERPRLERGGAAGHRVGHGTGESAMAAARAQAFVIALDAVGRRAPAEVVAAGLIGAAPGGPGRRRRARRAAGTAGHGRARRFSPKKLATGLALKFSIRT